MITLEEYKNLVNLKTVDFDLQIIELIDVVENDILAIRNKAWKLDSNQNPILPPDIKMIACEMISFKLNTLKGAIGLASESFGDYSASYSSDLMFGYPRSIVSRIKRYGRIL